MDVTCSVQDCFSVFLMLHFALQLKFGVDESYKLTVPAAGNPMYAQIEVSKRLVLNHCTCFSLSMRERE